jgi:hypothetical protein
MKAQIVEQIELFSKAELESLEFLPEELEAIEAERVPDLDSISFEDIAEDLEAAFEQDREAVLEAPLPSWLKKVWDKIRPGGRRPPSPPPSRPASAPPQLPSPQVGPQFPSNMLLPMFSGWPSPSRPLPPRPASVPPLRPRPSSPTLGKPPHR